MSVTTRDRELGVARRAPRRTLVRRALARRSVTVLAALAVVAAVLVAGGSQSSNVQSVADLSQFDPGNIISDEVFFAGSALSAADIQHFLNLQNGSCVAGGDGTPCLRDYTQDTTAWTADAYCNGYSPAKAESAAEIIHKVAVACNVNPKVLLVTLQKERGLVTASGSSLTSSDYRIAMGYGCPDTGPCDPSRFGFENQLYHAAWQFQKYAHNPDSYTYRAGHTVNILYNPSSSCGSSPVLIKNQATAGLYNYTPYQPNAAALRGGSDACSSFGNLNFWRYFTDWFVSTQSDAVLAASPKGVVDSLTVTSSGFATRGWSFDPDAPNDPVKVRATVDGVEVSTTTADLSRPDVAAVYHVGDQHGFSFSGYLSYGTHQVCVVADNLSGKGVQRQLGCLELTFTDQAPKMSIDSFAQRTDGSVRVTGWVFDPDGNPAQVVVTDNGAARTYTPTLARADVHSAFPAAPVNSGFALTLAPLKGTHKVCLSAVDTVAPGNTWQAECQTISYHQPKGLVDEISQTSTGTLHVRGWAVDPDLPTTSIRVHIYVDSKGTALTASLSRPDVARAVPGAGSAHGFDISLKVGPGTHRVCVFGINVGVPGSNPVIGCKTMTFKYTPPIGVVDGVTAVGDGHVWVHGWALDKDVPTAPVRIHYYVDGHLLTVGTASLSRPDVARAFPGVGSAHGFDATLDVGLGKHQVCTFAINLGIPGSNRLIYCRTVTVFDRAPIGHLDAATATTPGNAEVRGWSIDPDSPRSAVTVEVLVDGVLKVVAAAKDSRPDVGRVFPAAGPAHGFSLDVPVTAGSHKVCVAGVSTRVGGKATTISCATVTG